MTSVGRGWVPSISTRVRQAGWLHGEPCEQIQFDDRRRQEVRRVQAVAISIERSGVGPG